MPEHDAFRLLDAFDEAVLAGDLCLLVPLVKTKTPKKKLKGRRPRQLAKSLGSAIVLPPVPGIDQLCRPAHMALTTDRLGPSNPGIIMHAVDPADPPQTDALPASIPVGPISAPAAQNDAQANLAATLELLSRLDEDLVAEEAALVDAQLPRDEVALSNPLHGSDRSANPRPTWAADMLAGGMPTAHELLI